MWLKKQKRARRSMRFYTSRFGFKEPFKILCDGTFVHHILHSSIPHSQISKFLSASTKLFVTRCTLAELKSLGDSHSDSLRSARTLQIVRCVHERRKSAANCIVDVIGKSNSEHFFVATQDAVLCSKFHEGPNPLSCKKRKSSGPSHSQPQNAEIEGGTLSKRKRNQKRKRHQEESKLADATG